MNYLKLARPKHWLKNAFVLAPLFFAGKVSDPEHLIISILAFITFCIASSAIYIFNDIYDAEQDKKHPLKCNRPIPSGKVSVKSAWILFAVFILLAAALTVWFYIQSTYYFVIVISSFVVLNMFYSVIGKHIELIDAFCIAAGFVLRVIGGAYAIGVEPTGWIIVTTFFLALFLGFGKRRNEIQLLNGESGTHRKALQQYNIPLLDQIIVSTGTIAIISYALFTLDKRVIDKFGSDKLIYSIPFVAYGIFRYIYLLTKSSEGDPTELVTKDLPIIIDVILWLAVSYLIILLSGGQFRQ